jgi:fructosamine-3-kinase
VQTYRKSRPDAPGGFFEAEAAGLAWLRAAGGARTASVLGVGPGSIELELVGQVPPTAALAREFGAALSVTHAAGAPAFGSPPPGGPGSMFIGRRPLPSDGASSWGAFYSRSRVRPYLEVAERVGSVSRAGAALVRSCLEAIASGRCDDDEPAARIHGDLWAGNVLWSARSVVLIDPAAHGGHRETDLAMLALFGCPYLEEVYAGYQQHRPLRGGWRQRIDLHQLHPLAVHAAGHGRVYGDALVSAAEAVAARF